MYGDVKPIKNLQGTLSNNKVLEGALSNNKVLEGEVLQPERAYKSLSDYEKLDNLPRINGTVLIGDRMLEDFGLLPIYYDTTANWDSRRALISDKGSIYIYSDHKIYVNDVGDTIIEPGIRIGDGSTYLIDLPFLNDRESKLLLDHINDKEIHITEAERNFWNDKVTCFLDTLDGENLVFSKGGILNG